MTTDPIAVAFHEARMRFFDHARENYPKHQYPDWSWVLEQGLGLDLATLVIAPISKREYTVWVDGHAVVRRFDPQQRKTLREWWPLLTDELKAE